MQNARNAAIGAEVARLEAAMIKAGALHVEVASLLPAGQLLDLYGEDIRARAYVTHDPILGEQMMRPDFTVPIVERHMAEGAEPARYCYSGTVWRKQDASSARRNEYIQVGFELFDRAEIAASDAEVFALFAALLPKMLTVKTGDVGLLRAAVAGLSVSEQRRAALMRHLWRPDRFRQLLARFAGLTQADPARIDLIVAAGVQGIDTVIEEAGKPVGLRSVEDVKARIALFKEDAREAEIPASEVAVIETLMGLKGMMSEIMPTLDALVSDMPNLKSSVETFKARADELAGHGIDLAKLPFDGAYGLTNMEYYDGLVFGFLAGDALVATGGRYDALTAQLGQGREIAAVGGVIRPELLVEAGLC